MTRYIQYLPIKHEWDGINCITLIEKIYMDQINLSLDDMWKRMNFSKNDKIWYKKYNSIVIEETKNWINIELANIKEYDIIIFKSKKLSKILFHFGMYIDSMNKFIHLRENSYCQISELNSDYRELIYGIYRHPTLV